MRIAIFYRTNENNAEFMGIDKYCIVDGRHNIHRQLFYCVGYNVKRFNPINKNAEFVRFGNGTRLGECIDNARNSSFIKL